MPRLSTVKLTGSGSITADSADGDTVEAAVTGSGELKIVKLTAKRVELTMALAGGSFGLAATASAAPAWASSVEEKIYDLRTQGSNVHLQGTTNGTLSHSSLDSCRGAPQP